MRTVVIIGGFRLEGRVRRSPRRAARRLALRLLHGFGGHEVEVIIGGMGPRGVPCAYAYSWERRSMLMGLPRRCFFEVPAVPNLPAPEWVRRQRSYYSGDGMLPGWRARRHNAERAP